ncbi:BlaI/MecI/CopY family transcriptional regulator [Streptomyces sp. NPDC001941]|uniref:BlaI/MecI/CopY family transcriptional regulator n=1 Tax=Streptomyces sp. NPDC001941 TaxID=3154659 RepID=UPI00332FEB26
MAHEPMASQSGTRDAAAVTVPGTAAIHTRYSEQFSADLASNKARQSELLAELEQLRADEAWLRTSLNGLQGDGVPALQEAADALPAAAADETPAVAVPVQARGTRRKAATAAKPAARKTRRVKAKEQAAPARRGTKTSKVAKAASADVAKEAPAKAGKTAGPALGDLVLEVLRKTTGEPRTAREVFHDLGAGEPGRATSEQSVRNTLESLVKKGRAERSTQGRSVLYTAPAQAADAPASAAVVPQRTGEPQPATP